ncbi:MAG: D-tyrosyl-tRNA(Tyr) deacylase [Flavobacteriales bacterium]|jgi:D-tyrosyl-tRNA(Tyr) deacylase
MRAVIQRVSQASVRIDGETQGAIEKGLMILLGIHHEDQKEDVDWLVNKIIQLRIFPDKAGKMNLNLADVNGNALIISQFTLHAKTKKGTRPSFIHAARPEIAIPLYTDFLTKFEQGFKRRPERGEFGAMMEVELINSGPVTIVIDTKDRN